MSPSSRNAGATDRGSHPGGPSPPAKIDRYMIRRRLGRGGQGEVYLAHDPNLEIDVAIKVLHPEYRTEEFIDRFKVEARTAVRLTAPNIVRVYDFNPEYPYLVMEFCGDGDLNHYLKSRRRRPLAEILDITRQVCDALVAAHEHDPPILHRDIKPGNVLFQGSVPKVADFGLAKMLGGGTGLTTTRGMMGTVRYCSPEQLQDPSKVDHRADLWSVGVVLYELLTWTRPFDKTGDGYVNVAVRVRTEAPRQPPYELPGPVLEVIRRILQKSPDQRYRSAREMSDAISQALRAVPGADRLLVPPEQVVDDLSRMASRVADLMEEGRSHDAASVVREIRRIAPDDSVGAFWQRQLREVSETGSDASPSGGRSDDKKKAEWLAEQIESIKSLVHSRNYRDARRRIGELLVKDPDNTVIQRFLDDINAQESRLRRDLDQAHQDADRARAAQEYRKLYEIWKRLNDAYADLPEAEAELAVATRELQVHEQRKAREAAASEAGRHTEAGNLRSALDTWQSYTKHYPSDQEAAREQEEIRSVLRERERAERIAALRSETSRLRGSGDLKGALALWRRYLEEDAGSAEAASAAEGLRQEIAALERDRRLQEARSHARARLEAQELGKAVGAWNQFLADYPDHAEAREQVTRLEREIAEHERQSLAREVQRLASILAARLEAGRYGGLPAVRSEAGRALEGARASLTADVAALSAARAELVAARESAETGLSRELQSRRSRLRARAGEFREWIPADGVATDEGRTQAMRALAGALASALGALCEPAGPESSGDPLERLAAAEKALVDSAAALTRERQELVAAARAAADAALAEAQRSLEACRTLEEWTGPGGEESGSLRERLRQIRAQAETQVPERLKAVARQAAILGGEADAARLQALWRLSGETGSLLDEARSLALEERSGRLGELIRRTAQALELGEGDSAASAGALPGLRTELRNEVEVARRSREDRFARARERWDRALQAWRDLLVADLGPERRPGAERATASGKEAEEVTSLGEAAAAALRSDDLEIWAVQLEGLTRRYRLESTWIEQGNALLEVEGPPGPDGLPQDELEPEIEDLLERYRQAVSLGDHAGVRSLGSAVAQHAADLRQEQDRPMEAVGEAPDLSRRVRRFNQRYIPGALKAFDDLAARHRKCLSQDRRGEAARLAVELGHAHRKLLVPPPLWRGPLLPAGGAAIAAAAVLHFVTVRPSGPASVAVLSPAGETDVSEVRRDGTPLEDLTGVVPEGGVSWPDLKPGHYVVSVRGGSRVEFDVPGQGDVLLPGEGDYSDVLMRELKLDELKAQR